MSARRLFDPALARRLQVRFAVRAGEDSWVGQIDGSDK